MALVNPPTFFGENRQWFQWDEKFQQAKLLAAETGVVAPGDYAMKVTEDKKTDRGTVRKYDMDMTPGKHVTFQLAGLEE